MTTSRRRTEDGGGAEGASLPAPVRAVCEVVVGRVRSVEPLHGLSGAVVLRVSGPRGSVVTKGPAHAREVAAYTELADVLRESGVRLPQCFGHVAHVDGVSWLVLEDVSAPLPRARWGADPELVGVLRRLHAVSTHVLDLVPSPFEPAWDCAATEVAIARLGGADQTLEVGLSRIREAARPLFGRHVVISGDPNPLNWGISSRGELLLMDWERLGAGHPAIDLAVALPGLPSLAEAEAMVDAYMAAGPAANLDLGPTDLLWAKAWTVVELVAESAPSALEGSGLLEWLRAELSSWVEQVGQLLRRSTTRPA